MLVVHASWRDDQLLVWGEDGNQVPRRRSGRLPRYPRHPYAAGHHDLIAALGPVAAKATADTAPVPLPTVAGAPVSSPELPHPPVDPPARPGGRSLRSWLVPVLGYDPDAALRALPDLPGAEAVAGAGVRHLLRVAELAADLVRRGRLLPVVDPDTRRALWRPVLSGNDAAWVQALAAATPPSLRPEEADAAAVVATAVDVLTDAAARAALGSATLAPPGTRGVTGAWLRRLTGERRDLRADDQALRTLAAGIEEWQRDAAQGAVRACFRLREPAEPDQPVEPDDRWTLEFALQSVDEPSLVVDADHVWRGRGTRHALARMVASPQEALLAQLGRASRLYPALRPALRSARPAELRLDTTGAHDFLTTGAPALAAAGFEVLLPSWWTRPREGVGAKLSVRTAQPGQVDGTAGLDRAGVVEFEWRLALGDEELTEQELAELTALKTPLVRLRGRWVRVDPERLAAGIRVLGEEGRQRAGAAELVRLAAGEEGAPGDLPVTGVDAEGWSEHLLSGAVEHRLEPTTEPDGFAGALRPYQRRGLAWLEFLQRVGLGGVLADDMGLGKTAQTLALVVGDRQDGADHGGPTLLVCPMSVVGNWQREVARFTPGMRVHVHHGAERLRGPELAAAVQDADLVITTYALAARDAAALGAVSWHRVVADEAQALKNAATRQATAVRALPARHRLALTGTPVENRLADLWSLMEFVNPGLLGPAATFRRRYAEPVERHGDEEATARLRRLTGPFILRRVKTDREIVPDLPEKWEMEVLCNLTAEQASLYQAVVDDMLTKVEASDGMERRGLVLASLARLKQVCNHPAQVLRDGTRLAGRSGKLARLEEILEEVLAAGERSLLFTQYAEFGGMLRQHLTARFGREVAWLHGGLPKRERDALVDRFQSDAPDAPVMFLLSLKAGGTGLNLTAANHVVHVDRWWNPAVEDQATDRAFRIGQDRTVQVRKLVCAGTVEEKVAAMIQNKRALAGAVMGTGEEWLTELSTAQLRELVTLEDGAVVE